jgi:very-short-patch-repair endonuclease
MKTKPPKGKSLAEINPELAKEWHPTKNDDLTPFDVTQGSDKKVWWKCDKGDDHEWEISIYSRNSGSGCSVCSGRTVVKSNSLATLNPELAKEWHPTKNGKLTPYAFTNGSSKKVWWKCDKGDDHEWESKISNRTINNNGCSVCSGRTAVKSNCLGTLNSELAKEWHPIKNDKLTPFDVVVSSNKKVWWKCDKGDDHEWEATVNSRNGGNGCPVCSNYKIVKANCLATFNPGFLKEWHPTKNKYITPFDIGINYTKKVWWKCDKDETHVWEATVLKRKNNRGCPFCTRRQVNLSNCLATLNPELTKEWHSSKNGKLTPYDVVPGYAKKVWWKCDKGDDHEWETTVNKRNNNRNCPICRGKKVVKSNSLATLHPKLVREWHPIKNGILSPNQITLSSHTKVWWKCDKGDDHEWKTRAMNRIFGKTGCPYCDLTPQSKQELTITFELINFFKINPKGFKTIVQGKIWSIDIYIHELKLGIEFDGSYWHKDKDALDKLKTERLEDDGFKIMRIREEPLIAVTDIDVISKKPYNAKEITNNILRQILKIYSLDTTKVQKIEEYIIKEAIQNENGLDTYIEEILKEKSERKANNK